MTETKGPVDIGVTVKNNAPTAQHGSNVVAGTGSDDNYKYTMFFSSASSQIGDSFTPSFDDQERKMKLDAQEEITIDASLTFPAIADNADCQNIDRICLTVEPGVGSHYNQDNNVQQICKEVIVSCKPGSCIANIFSVPNNCILVILFNYT